MIKKVPLTYSMKNLVQTLRNFVDPSIKTSIDRICRYLKNNNCRQLADAYLRMGHVGALHKLSFNFLKTFVLIFHNMYFVYISITISSLKKQELVYVKTLAFVSTFQLR